MSTREEESGLGCNDHGMISRTKSVEELDLVEVSGLLTLVDLIAKLHNVKHGRVDE